MRFGDGSRDRRALTNMRPSSFVLALALAGCLDHRNVDSSSAKTLTASERSPDAGTPQCQFYFCRGNTIYQLDPVPVSPDLLGCEDPDYDTAVPIDSCE